MANVSVAGMRRADLFLKLKISEITENNQLKFSVIVIYQIDCDVTNSSISAKNSFFKKLDVYRQ